MASIVPINKRLIQSIRNNDVHTSIRAFRAIADVSGTTNADGNRRGDIDLVSIIYETASSRMSALWNAIVEKYGAVDGLLQSAVHDALKNGLSKTDFAACQFLVEKTGYVDMERFSTEVDQIRGNFSTILRLFPGTLTVDSGESINAFYSPDAPKILDLLARHKIDLTHIVDRGCSTELHGYLLSGFSSVASPYGMLNNHKDNAARINAIAEMHEILLRCDIGIPEKVAEQYLLFAEQIKPFKAGNAVSETKKILLKMVDAIVASRRGKKTSPANDVFADRTLLHAVSGITNDDISHALVEHLMSVSPQMMKREDETGRTPYEIALFEGNVKTCTLYERSGYDIARRPKSPDEKTMPIFKTLLRMVSSRRFSDIPKEIADYIDSIVSTLKRHGIDIVNEKSHKNGETLLSEACNVWNPSWIEFLLSHGAKVNVENNEGLTPFHHITTWNYATRELFFDTNSSLLKKLLKHGVSEGLDLSKEYEYPSQRETKWGTCKETLFHTIMRMKYSSSDNPGNNPVPDEAFFDGLGRIQLKATQNKLCNELSMGRFDISERLFQEGASATLPCDTGKTPMQAFVSYFHNISGNEDMESVMRLIKKMVSDGANIDDHLPGQSSLLFVFLKLRKNPEVIKKLLSLGASLYDKEAKKTAFSAIFTGNALSNTLPLIRVMTPRLAKKLQKDSTFISSFVEECSSILKRRDLPKVCLPVFKKLLKLVSNYDRVGTAVVTSDDFGFGIPDEKEEFCDAPPISM